MNPSKSCGGASQALHQLPFIPSLRVHWFESILTLNEFLFHQQVIMDSVLFQQPQKTLTARSDGREFVECIQTTSSLARLSGHFRRRMLRHLSLSTLTSHLVSHVERGCWWSSCWRSIEKRRKEESVNDCSGKSVMEKVK